MNEGPVRRIIVQRNPVQRELPWPYDSQVGRISPHGHQAADTIQALIACELIGFNQEDQWGVLPLVDASKRGEDRIMRLSSEQSRVWQEVETTGVEIPDSGEVRSVLLKCLTEGFHGEVRNVVYHSRIQNR